MELNNLYILLPIVLWPLAGVLLAKISRAKGSLTLSFYRQFGMFLIGLPLLFVFSIPYEVLIDNWLNIFFATLFGSIQIFVTFLGFDYLPVGYSRIFTVISRVFISLGIGFIIFGETLSLLQIMGLVSILAGIIFLKPSNINVSHLKKKSQVVGIGLAILAGIMFSIHLYYFKLFSSKLNSLIAAYVLEVGNGLFLGILLSIMSFKSKKVLFKLPWKSFFATLLLSPLILLGTFGSAKACALFPFSIVNICFVFVLMFSIIFSWFFLKEKLTKKEILIFGLMIIGLIFLKI